MLKREDRPLFLALLAIAFSIFLNVQTSSPKNLPAKNNADYNHTQNIGDEMISWLLGWSAEDSIAIFTVVIAAIGYFQWRHFRVTERSYVKLSHLPPGIYWEVAKNADPRNDRKEERDFWVRFDLRVKNFGNTPSIIRDVRMVCKPVPKGERLPDRPDYSKSTINPMDTFLVKDDQFVHQARIVISDPDLVAVWNGEKILFLFGYVEYVDRFGAVHRGGYARRYDREMDGTGTITIDAGQSLQRTKEMTERNNLPFIDQRHYNYDITQNFDGSWPDS